MRRNLLVVILVGTVLSLSMWSAATALGQGGRAAASPSYETRVALVDLAYIFKKYEKFNRLSEEMKAEVQNREGEIVQLQNELKLLMAKRAEQNPGTSTYKDYDEKIVKTKTSLELLTDTSRREFTQREAGIYHQTYQEVEAAIRQYAEAKGFTLVLRAARDEPVSAANPQDVIKEVSQQVIYSLPQMDITDAILEMLNRSGSSASRQQPTTQQGKPSGQPPPKTTTAPQKNGTQKR